MIIIIYYCYIFVRLLYVSVGIFLTWGKLLNHRTISLRQVIWAHEYSLTRHFVLQYLSKITKVRGRAFMKRFCLFLPFLYCILELFQCLFFDLHLLFIPSVSSHVSYSDQAKFDAVLPKTTLCWFDKHWSSYICEVTN